MEKIDAGKAREICVAVSRYFKSQGISHKEITRRLGYSNISAVDNQLSSRRFGKRIAERWAREFGFSEKYLMTGQGRLIERESGYQKLVRENQTLKAIVRIQKDMLSNQTVG